MAKEVIILVEHTNGPAHGIIVLITLYLKHACITIRRAFIFLIFELNLTFAYFALANSEGSCKTVWMRRLYRASAGRQSDELQNYNMAKCLSFLQVYHLNCRWNATFSHKIQLFFSKHQYFR